MQIGYFFCFMCRTNWKKLTKNANQKRPRKCAGPFFIVSQLRPSTDEIEAYRSRKSAVDRGLSVC
jgi:hypothetical protein